MRRHGWEAVLAVALALVAVAGCGSTPPPATPAPPAPLRILLVTDDGWNAPGTVVLRDALRRAGHKVTEVAPAVKRDNDGMATTMTGQFVARRPTRDPDVWTVTGTPSDATLFGLRAVMAKEPPALVISGINAGATVGVSALQSGAVGAALTAASNSAPAMAVSTDVADPVRARPEEFRATADFVVRTVALLQRQQNTLLLMPARTVLNINYPGGPEAPDGVANAPTAAIPSYSMIYRRGPGGTFTPVPISRDQSGEDNDATALRQGRVVLTDLSSDPDRSAPPPRVAARLAPLLKP